MPIIESITTAPYRLPLKSPLRWGNGHELAELEHVLVRVTLRNGAVGLAEATPRPTIYGESPESIAAVIRHQFAPQLVNQQLSSQKDIARITASYRNVRNNNTAKGAVDLALWTALARSEGMMLGELFGDKLLDRVRVSYILGTGTTETVLQEVDSVYRAGIRVLKVKVGKQFQREADLIRQITSNYPDMDVYVDANQCYDYTKAIAQLEALRDLKVLFVEEPLPVNRLVDRTRLKRLELLPIIADDSAFTLDDLEREIAVDTFDILNIKTPRNGYTEATAMLAMAQKAGRGVMVGSQASSALGCSHALLFASHSGIDYPSEGSFFLKTTAATKPFPIRDGYVLRTDLEAALSTLHDQLLATVDFKTPTALWMFDQVEEGIRLKAHRQKLASLQKVYSEMRGYLPTLVGFADLIDNPLIGQTTDEQQQYLSIIRDNANRAMELLEDASWVSVVEAKALKLNYADVNLGQVIAKAMTAYQFHENKNVQVSIDIDKNLPSIEADAARLHHMLTELLDNAFKFTLEGSISVEAQLEDPSHVLITVQDTGVGMSDAFVPHVWTPYRKEIPMKVPNKGNGVGMMIARAITEAHNGKMWCFSKESMGTVIYASLPVSRGAT